MEKLRDLFGRAIGRIALEGLERHLIEPLHPLGEGPTRRFTGGTEAAPDVDRMLEAARIPVSATGMLTDLFDDRVEAAGRDPDSQPAIAEPSGAPHGRVGPASDDERNRRFRRRDDERIADGEELAVKADRLAVGEPA